MHCGVAIWRSTTKVSSGACIISAYLLYRVYVNYTHIVCTYVHTILTCIKAYSLLNPPLLVCLLSPSRSVFLHEIGLNLHFCPWCAWLSLWPRIRLLLGTYIYYIMYIAHLITSPNRCYDRERAKVVLSKDVRNKTNHFKMHKLGKIGSEGLPNKSSKAECNTDLTRRIKVT
jgi:hypothetical protein